MLTATAPPPTRSPRDGAFPPFLAAGGAALSEEFLRRPLLSDVVISPRELAAEAAGATHVLLHLEGPGGGGAGAPESRQRLADAVRGPPRRDRHTRTALCKADLVA